MNNGFFDKNIELVFRKKALSIAIKMTPKRDLK